MTQKIDFWLGDNKKFNVRKEFNKLTKWLELEEICFEIKIF